MPSFFLPFFTSYAVRSSAMWLQEKLCQGLKGPMEICAGVLWGVKVGILEESQQLWHRLAPNHLEERLLDQVQVRTHTPPLLGGRSRSIPEGIILDV